MRAGDIRAAVDGGLLIGAASNEDDDALAATGEEVTDRLVALLGAPDSRGPVPETDQVDALWERPDLAVVVSSCRRGPHNAAKPLACPPRARPG